MLLKSKSYILTGFSVFLRKILRVFLRYYLEKNVTEKIVAGARRGPDGRGLKKLRKNRKKRKKRKIWRRQRGKSEINGQFCRIGPDHTLFHSQTNSLCP
jgi:ribosomal protein L27